MIFREAQNRIHDPAKLNSGVHVVDSLPAPEIIAREIVEDLTAASAEFEVVSAALEASAVRSVNR